MTIWELRPGPSSVIKGLKCIVLPDPNINDFVYRGQTALHKAAWYQRRTICCMLVEAKASLSRKDYQGNTPRMQALKADDRELAAYLESKDFMCSVIVLSYRTDMSGQIIRAGPWENVSYVICKQQRHRSACASMQSDQHLCCWLLR